MKKVLGRGLIITAIFIFGISSIASCGDTPIKRLLRGAITGDPQIVMVIDPLNPPQEITDLNLDVQNEPLSLATSTLSLMIETITTQVGADLVMGQPFIILGINFGWFPTVTIENVPAPVLLVEGKGNLTVVLAQVPTQLLGPRNMDVEVVNDEGKQTPPLTCSFDRIGGILNNGSNSSTRFYTSWGLIGQHYPLTLPNDIQFGNAFNLDTFQITPDGLFILGLDIAQKAIAVTPIVELPKDLITRTGNTSDINFPVTVKLADIADTETANLIAQAQGYGLTIDITDLVISPDGNKAALAVDAPIVVIPPAPPAELLPDAVVIVDISILSDLASLVKNNTLDQDQASKFSMQYIELAIGANPRNLVFSPTGDHLLVSNDGTNTVTVIDANAGSIVGTVDLSSVGVGPREIAFRRVGVSPAITVDHAIVVLDEDTVGGVGGITRFNLTDFISTGTPPALTLIPGVDSNPRAIVTIVSADVVSGIYAYVANSGGSSISVFNLDTNAYLAGLAVGAAPMDIDLSRENAITFFACRDTNELWGADYFLSVDSPTLTAYAGLSTLDQPVKVVVQIKP